MSEVTVRVSSGLGLSLGGKIVEVTPYRMVLGLALIGLRLGSLGNRIHSRVRGDTFTLKVPRWLYDYFSLGVFIMGTL